MKIIAIEEHCRRSRPGTRTRTLDGPAYDDLFAAAAWLQQPIFIHPQIPSSELRDAAYEGLDPLLSLGPATFG